LRLFGPRGAKKLLGEAVKLGVERAPFVVAIEEVAPGEVLGRDGYDIHVFATEHGGPGSVGYALREPQRLGRFDPDKARAMGIAEGPLWGRIHKGETIALDDGRVVTPAELVGEPRPGRAVVITGDTRPCAAVVDAATARIYWCTKRRSRRRRRTARGDGALTAREAAQVALAARVGRLVLSHVSARYSLNAEELVTEAREVFPATVVAKDGMTIEIPLRGE
jgi:ribonuclease Z